MAPGGTKTPAEGGVAVKGDTRFTVHVAHASSWTGHLGDASCGWQVLSQPEVDRDESGNCGHGPKLTDSTRVMPPVGVPEPTGRRTSVRPRVRAQVGARMTSQKWARSA